MSVAAGRGFLASVRRLRNVRGRIGTDPAEFGKPDLFRLAGRGLVKWAESEGCFEAATAGVCAVGSGSGPVSSRPKNSRLRAAAPRVRLPSLALFGCTIDPSAGNSPSLLRPFQATPELGSGTILRAQILFWPSLASEKWLIPEKYVGSGLGWRSRAGTKRRPTSIVANAQSRRTPRRHKTVEPSFPP
jgi:hypothetical protein